MQSMDAVAPNRIKYYVIGLLRVSVTKYTYLNVFTRYVRIVYLYKKIC